jgi:ABC-type transporter Mla maintaining outer membrane lipid asymmetry ATPase subunit MlaF
MMSQPVLQILNVKKSYQSLRPLRMRELSIGAGERVAISGLDEGASEVLVNLVTGASLPDEGEVIVLGENTRAIADGDAWLTSLDRFGIVSPRAVLLDGVTLLQNLAMPFTLQIDPLAPDVAERARAIGIETGIEERWIDLPIAQLPADMRVRAHLARAVALDPALLVLVHPTAGLEQKGHQRLAFDVERVAAARSLATLIISQDPGFSRGAAHRTYELNAATGKLNPPRGRFFGL